MLCGHYFPGTRLRRLRRNAYVRSLVAECTLQSEHLILPLFVTQEKASQTKAFSDVLHHLHVGVGSIVDFVRSYVEPAGLAGVALFPAPCRTLKSQTGEAALQEDALIPVALNALKKNCPSVMLLADVALDPYTCHGHDGIIKNNDVDNDATVDRLVKMSLLYAESGADALGPSAMMDGCVHAIRNALEKMGYHETLIISYAVKYASCFYAPFRRTLDALPAKKGAHKKTYQIEVCNKEQALKQAEQDASAGADMLIVKPGMTSLDIVSILKQRLDIPLLCYHVSGSFAMLKAASEKGWVDYQTALLETLLAMRRAGASGIITYGALDAANYLRNANMI